MFAHVAQLVEHTLGKGEVGSSNLLMSSIKIDRACSIKLRTVAFYLKINGWVFFLCICFGHLMPWLEQDSF
jgi:hypothetical protein